MKKFLYAVLSVIAVAFASTANASYSKFDRQKLSTEARCLADMAYWEARGEGPDGIKAVVDVMFNRLKSKHFPSTICGNFKKRNQYESYRMIGKKTDPLMYFYVVQITERERAKYHLGEWRSSVGRSEFFNSHGRAPTKNTRFHSRKRGHYFYVIAHKKHKRKRSKV